MRLGIPTLCRYDLLKELIQSAEQGEQMPDGYIIVDNGGRLTREEVYGWMRYGSYSPVTLDLITPDSNLGVAASWNRIIELAGPEDVIISNDDIVFNSRTFLELIISLRSHDFVEGDGWALFGQRSGLTKTVGWYDENFWPAYYEDVDYDLRLAKAGIVPHRPLTEPVRHHGWATQTATGNPDWLREGRERNHAYFLAKWGGESKNPRWNGTPDIVHYDRPFNGNPPEGWSERRRVPTAVSMHWDVLNYLVRRLDVHRYLEIGVANGECLRHVQAKEKWGVDPYINEGGVKSADFFIPKTSVEFFKTFSMPAGFYFDLVFIDGDHRAEVVYEEVHLARQLLSDRGVICLHDCNPYTEEMQQVPYRPGLWTGDVWKAVARLRSEGEFHVGTVPFDYGTTILIPSSMQSPAMLTALPCSWDRLMWRDLATDRERLLGLLDPVRWTDWVDQKTRGE